MWQKKLRLTADDFGLHRDISDGILECVEQGVVNSISVVVTGEDFKRIAPLLRGMKGVEVGLHVTLTEVPPLLGRKASSLLPGGKPFRHALHLFAALPFIRKEEIYLEARAQLELLLEYTKVSHLNSHQHVHLFPGLFDIFLRLAREFHIPYIRLIKERPDPLYGARNLFLLFLNSLYPLRKRRLKGTGIEFPERTWGFLAAGRGDELSFEAFILEGEGEAILHPGRETPQLLKAFGYWNYRWNRERKMLLRRKELIRALISPAAASQMVH